ncbi:hypothetical protein U1Q18_045176 [Sarracenia purpurea var. burkii]
MALLTSLSNRFFLSGSPRFLTSISLGRPSSPVSMPLLICRYVGSFCSAAHFNAPSSSSSRDDLEKTSPAAVPSYA